MSVVVSLQGFKPIARFDDVPWTHALIQESATADGVFTTVEDVLLDPVDADPEHPAARNLTTNAATLAHGYYRVQFTDASSNTDTSAVVYNGPDDLDGYPSVGALLAESTVDELTGLDAAALDTTRASAIRAIEAYCGQEFVPFDGEMEARAEGRYEVYMPRRLRSITSITPYGGEAMELDAVRIEMEGKKIRFERSAVGRGYYSQALQEVSGGDYATGFRVGTLLIDGEWGWATTPQGIERAIRFDMEDQALAEANQLSATTHAFRRMGLNAIGQGSLRAQLVTPPTLTPRVVREVEPYLWLGPGGRLV